MADKNLHPIKKFMDKYDLTNVEVCEIACVPCSTFATNLSRNKDYANFGINILVALDRASGINDLNKTLEILLRYDLDNMMSSEGIDLEKDGEDHVDC